MKIFDRIHKAEKANRLMEAIHLLLKARKEYSADPVVYLECTNHLANDYFLLGYYEEAEQYAAESFSIKEDDRVGNTLGISQLFNGKILEGFDKYRYRWGSNEVLIAQYKALHNSINYLDNWDDLFGKRLFIIGEQGFGDDLMFSHVFKYVEPFCTSIFLLSRYELGTFFRANLSLKFKMEVENYYTTSDEFLKQNYDYIVTSGDLFRLYVLKYKELPALSEYECVQSIEPLCNTQQNVGFVFSPGNKGNATMERKVPPKAFSKLKKGYNLFNFQIGQTVPFATNLSDNLKCFLDTANYLDGMDGVVTVDTAFAHLALAMKKKTVVVYDRYLDWRFRIGLYKDVTTLSVHDPRYLNKIAYALGD